MRNNKVPVAKILDANDKELMAIRGISGENGNLVIRGKIFGAMPMVAKLTPAEARAALKLLDFRTFLFLLTLLFRK
ncbi:hypothetical protein [Novosphingobium sp.]|uniref:hypothetical protein n=1 Tax=Novosphingobium sp. TaxID=1874826 RepID=UPI00286DD682|nr:hypothetical protein [Novosphingobium sp.]